jgi:hypothetical protein
VVALNAVTPPSVTQNPAPENLPLQQNVAALTQAPSQAQFDTPIFRGLFQNDPVSASTPISQDVRSLWGGVNPFLRRTT